MVFDDPSRFTGLECMFAIYGYALVIYSDFSGYSDMAIGMGKWLGFDINRNFDSPYQSLNITEFWRRWHMSLSSWLKDYLYISLGGNRNGKIRTNINLLITMLLGGLWHGASWNFLFWGFLHGSALIIHKKWVDNVVPKFSVFNKFPRTTNVIAVMITFHFVCFCWIFFKAENFTQAWTMIYQIATNFYVSGWSLFLKNYYSVLLVMIIGFALHFSPQRWCEAIIDKISDYPWWLKSVGAFSILYLIIQFKQAEPILPVYLQF
jgi:D-alanyl-lipoteichoic acid acyltransferase DltB (MBOAT superfamily)